MRIAGLEEGPTTHVSLPRPKSTLREAAHPCSLPQINKIHLSCFHLFLSKSLRKTASRTGWKGCSRGTQKLAGWFLHHILWNPRSTGVLWGLQGLLQVGRCRYSGSPI